MKKHLIKLSLFVLGLAVITACNKEDEGPVALSPQEAAVEIDNMSSAMSSDIRELSNSEAINNLNTMFSLISADASLFGRIEDSNEGGRIAKEKISVLKRMFVPEKAIYRVSADNFDYNAYVGVYNWNPFEERFVQEGVSDIIELNFPSEGSDSNNATFRLTDYAEVEFTDEFGSFYEPTTIEADLSVDGNELANLSLAATYNSFGDPTSLDISFFVTPFTFTLTFDDTQSTLSFIEASLTLNNENVVSSGINVTFTDATKDIPTRIEGFVQYRNVRLDGVIDAENVDSEVADFNELITLELSADGRKIGDIEFVMEEVTDEYGYTYEDWVPYVKYADSSMEKLEDLLAPVIEEAEQLALDFENWGF